MKLLLTYLFCLLSLGLFAQTAVIKGKVYDKNRNILIGASVVTADSSAAVYSNELGYYQLTVPAGQLLTVTIRFFDHVLTRTIAPLDVGEQYRMDVELNAVFELIEVETRAQRVRRDLPSVTEIKPREIERFPVATGIEQTLKSIALGVGNSGGELSSGYNVRGGNFDENLVYVNGIEVYRPFLARSGQQEGLSIINPDLVENIRFSSGGFEAKYGDKLSSVLDIKYRTPDSMRGTAHMSLLGVNLHFEGTAVHSRLSYLVGARYRSNQYLLGSLDVQGDYKPRFYDVQSLINFRLRSDMDIQWFASYAQNRYLVAPQSQTTNFGTLNQAFSLNVAFAGQELMRYNTLINGLKLNYRPGKKTDLNLIFSTYNASEREHFTVEGAYRLDELETNLGSDNFANVRQNLGFGYFIDNARNDLRANVYSAAHKGSHRFTAGRLDWGVTYKHERIEDQLKEWRYNDSSGYNINTIGNQTTKDEILLDEYLKADISLQSSRLMGYVQHALVLHAPSDLRLTYGLRSHYWNYNQQNVVSPRVNLSYQPNKAYNDSLISGLDSLHFYDSLARPDWLFKAAFGYYYQPPFYRELRNLDGVLNPTLRAQQSIHFVLGSDLNFKAWGRPFKFVSEVYFKHLDDMVPYVIDNVRIRYLAENSSSGYATGLDARINGEFISGVESWFNMSLLKTMERIYYTDESGQRQRSDWLRRPTDQTLNFSILFQDELPNNPSYKMNLNLVYGSAIPYFFDGGKRYKEGFRIPSYERVDIGFSKVVFEEGKGYKPSWLGRSKSLWISLEVFNLLQANNTISFSLFKDFSNNVYGVPNYLTGRRLNLRFVLKV